MDEAAETIGNVLEQCGYLLDPHTATAVHVARQQPASEVPMVILSTAHPAKFPDAVEAASGTVPALPAWLSGLMEKPEKFEVLSSDLKMLEDYVEERARAAV